MVLNKLIVLGLRIFFIVIASFGFQFSCHDFALFVRCITAGWIIFSLYVDDMITTSDDHDGI